MAAQVAVVGSGLAGFTAYQTLRRAFQPAELVVFGTDADPAAAWRVRAAAIRQRAMRSESDGHCLPTTFPGLALRSVRRRRSLRPLLESLADRYHPTVEEFLAHVAELRERSRWDESLVLHRVERVRAVEGGFEVDGERFRHVLLAPGHPGLNVPEELRHDPRAVHAYEPHGYAPAVTVVGAGLAAATEWLNALAAGAEVVSVRRREPLRRPLNVPREYFSRRALADFHRLPAPQRVERLRALSAPSYPPGRAWDEPLARAAAEGRFRIQAAVNGTGQIICATGFLRGWRHDPAARPARRRARAPHRGGLDRARRRLGRARAQRPDADAGPRRRSRPVGLPRGRHARRRPLRRPPLPAPDPRMSYTLRGRVESRLAALLPLLLGCCAATGVLHEWWPVELCALMAAVGLALDVELWHRLLPYQPAWAAVPLGLAELGGLMAIVAGAGLHVPLRPALVLFGAGWLVSFALAQAGFPLLRLGYAEEGGELGRAGVAAAAAVALTLAGAAATVVVRLPPVVHLRAGVHRGPLVIRRREILQGAPGAVVRGGIVVAHDDVQIRDVTVVGGTNGITVDGVRGTVLDGVTVEGAKLDGIHVRLAGVIVRNCTVDMLGNPLGQGIDISFNMDLGMSAVEGCTIVGGQEGITTHSSMTEIVGNRVSRTTGAAIDVDEMSMGTVARNVIRDALGVAVYCNDRSICQLERNTVVDTRPDPASGSRLRRGFAVLASFESEAHLWRNRLVANPVAAGAVTDSLVRWTDAPGW